MQDLSLIVMAAGKGTRYGGLKQIDPVGPSDEAILDYSVYDAINAGFTKIIFVISTEIDEIFTSFMGGKLPDHVEVHYVHQDNPLLNSSTHEAPPRNKPWGTAHAIVAASAAINEPFAIVNGDDFYGKRSFHQISDYLRSYQKEICMVGFKLRNTLSDYGSVKRGVCLLGDKQTLEGIVEVEEITESGDTLMYQENAKFARPLYGQEIVSMNMWGMQPEIVSKILQQWNVFLEANRQSDTAEFYIPSAVNDIINATDAECHVLETPEKWFGVTYKEDRPQVARQIENLVKERVYPSNLWAN